jgi:hypothetical protein
MMTGGIVWRRRFTIFIWIRWGRWSVFQNITQKWEARRGVGRSILLYFMTASFQLLILTTKKIKYKRMLLPTPLLASHFCVIIIFITISI